MLEPEGEEQEEVEGQRTEGRAEGHYHRRHRLGRQRRRLQRRRMRNAQCASARRPSALGCLAGTNSAASALRTGRGAPRARGARSAARHSAWPTSAPPFVRDARPCATLSRGGVDSGLLVAEAMRGWRADDA